MLLAQYFLCFCAKYNCSFTSNSHPKDLYKMVYNANYFKFINNILLNNVKIFCLDSDIDYRKKLSDNLEKIFSK